MSAAHTDPVFEKHFTPHYWAETWGLSVDTVQRWAEDEDGVLRCGTEGGRGKQRRLTVRISESVARSMYAKHTKKC